jgi:hypothetical protein
MKVTLTNIFLVSLFLFTRGPEIFSALNTNLATVIFSRVLWQENHPAIERQYSLHIASRLLNMAVAPQEAAQILDNSAAYQMIPSMIIAEHYRRQRDLDMAAIWLHRAANATPNPPIQSAIYLPGIIGLAPDGSIVLHGDSPIWHVRRDTKVQAQLTRSDDGISIFTFDRHLTERNRAVLSWNYPFTIPYHHQLSINVKVSDGCSLQIETVIDNTNVRHPIQPHASKIYHGTDKWESLTVAVEGIDLRFIYIVLDLDTDAPDVLLGCTMEFESVVFALDNQ